MNIISIFHKDYDLMDFAKLSSTTTPLTAFLILLEGFANEEKSWKSLEVLWLEVSKKELPEDSFAAYAKLLSQYKIIHKKADSEKIDVIHNRSKEPSTELISQIESMISFETALSEKYEDKYSFYQSSWGLADVLREAYTIDLDPGIIVGDYLKLFFQEAIPKSSLFQEDKVPIIHGSKIHKLFFDIGISCIEASVPAKHEQLCLKLALQVFFSPKEKASFTSDVSFEDVLKSVISAPEGYFGSWASEWWLSYDEDQKVVPAITAATLKVLFKHATLQSDGCRNASGKKSIITLNHLIMLFSKISEDSSLKYDPELEVLLAEIHTCYGNIRKKKYFGVSPLNYTEASDLCRLLEYEGYDISICDLTTILATGFLLSGDTYLLPISNGDVFPSEYEDKETAYLVLFEKAVNDGFPELANALISLYLIARAFYCRCTFSPDNRLYTTILNGLSLPGAKVLKRTLEIIVTWVDDYLTSEPTAMLSYRFFKQFLPQQAILHLLHGEGKESNKQTAEHVDIEAFYVSQLGLDRWAKLCDESKDQLKTAELLWRKCYAEFGFGITDCSGLITNFSKVIEKELVDRLETFYYSPQYQTFFEEKVGKKPDKKPSIGILVRELLDYQKLPQNLRKIMDDSRLTVQHNRDLVRELQKIGTFRNQAAHKDEFNIVKFSEFKKIYFQDRLIHRFIDCLH